MTKFDIPVNFKVTAETEEAAEQNVLAFLRMAKLDFGLTYGIVDTDLFEFLVKEGNDI